jgi:hypothetical protein
MASTAVREQGPQLRVLEVLVIAAVIQGVDEPTIRLEFSGLHSQKRLAFSIQAL